MKWPEEAVLQMSMAARGQGSSDSGTSVVLCGEPLVLSSNTSLELEGPGDSIGMPSSNQVGPRDMQ